MFKSLLALALVGLLSPAHDFHVSKTNIRYVAEREQVQVEMHLFLDDLEIALTEAGAPNLYIGTEDELPQASRMIARYVDKHFRINWNGKELPTGMLGFELSDDLQAIWIYLSADTTEAPAKVSIQQTVLTEIYADQRNMVKLFFGEESTTLLMSRDQPQANYNFQ